MYFIDVWPGKKQVTLFLFLRTTFLRTWTSDFPKIKNSLSLISGKLRTKTCFSLKEGYFFPKMLRTLEQWGIIGAITLLKIFSAILLCIVRESQVRKRVLAFCDYAIKFFGNFELYNFFSSPDKCTWIFSRKNDFYLIKIVLIHY